MKSTNFEILREGWPELAALGGFAEAYAHADPASALVKMRLFAENVTKDIYRDLRLPRPDQPTFVDLLKNQAFSAITPKVILDKLHALRIYGNKAAHGEQTRTQNALWLLKEAHDLARWLLVQYGGRNAKDIAPFKQPAAPEAHQVRERRQILEKLAAQEAQMDALLQELDAARQKVAVAEKKTDELEAIAASARSAANELEFDEATTRTRLIDTQLASVGWDVGLGLESTEEVRKELEVTDQPTASGIGYADYVLRDDDGSPLAVIEAKKTSVDPEQGRHQAKLYADGLEKKYGQRPVIFYTNGYDIWIWDDAQGLPAAQAVRFLLQGQPAVSGEVPAPRTQSRWIRSKSTRIIANRLYQIEAIKRVCEQFTEQAPQGADRSGNRHRKDPRRDRANRSSDPCRLGQACAVPVRSARTSQTGQECLQRLSCRVRHSE